jgi:hypothetical protein
MKMNFDSLEAWCKTCSKEYDYLEQAVYDYAIRERLDRPFRAELRRHEELLRKVPDKFADLIVGALVMHLVLGSENSLRRFLAKSAYSPRDERAFASITAKAWRFSFFQTEERIAEGFFPIQEMGGERDVLLYSNAVDKRNGANSTFFLSGLFDDGECVQTFGPVLQMDAFVPEDIESFARLAAPDLFAARGLGAVLEREALKFSLLFAFANSPIPVHDDKPVVYASSSIRIDDKFLSSLAALPEREALKGGAWVIHLVKDWTPFPFWTSSSKRKSAGLFSSRRPFRATRALRPSRPSTSTFRDCLSTPLPWSWWSPWRAYSEDNSREPWSTAPCEATRPTKPKRPDSNRSIAPSRN